MTNTSPAQNGTLYVVATPIGNRDDVSARAIETLSTVDLILVEDTRHSRPFLQQLNIQTPLKALHEHNEDAQLPYLLELLEQGQSIALISDAGTPLISDPGYRLVNALRQDNITVTPIPGPCALIAALCVSGIATDQFHFVGFLSNKSSARRTQLQALSAQPHTMIFYESPHRIVDSLQDMSDVLGAERQIHVAREITKLFEQHFVGDITTVIEHIQSNTNHQRGEFVVVVSGYQNDDANQLQARRLLTQLHSELPLKQACRIVAEHYDLSKNKLYQWALEHLNK